MKFLKLGVHQQLAARAQKLGFSNPTPIQEQAIPAACAKHDLIGLAQTGTGKTAAFVLPILHFLIENQKFETQKRRTPGKKQIKALVVAPTRELAEQIHDVFVSFSQGLPVRSTVIFGGVNINRQIEILKSGVDVVVACPGRLLDHINRNTIDLSGVSTYVLDEADQMFDMGFLPDIRKITLKLPEKRQTLLFSATMPGPIEKLTKSILTNPKKIQVDRQEAAKQVAHSLYPVAQNKKTELLEYVIKNQGVYSALVFTRTKHRAKNLAKKLDKTGFKATALHGNLSINQRRHAVDGFKKGKYHIMVATDIAARGIDISNISHVINFDVPESPETYIHRIGRTGRAAQNGVAYTFVDQKEMRMVSQIEKALKSKLQINKYRLDEFAG